MTDEQKAGALAPASLDVTQPEIVEQIRKLCAENFTDAEFATLIQIVQATKLNPIVKEIWPLKFGNRCQIFIGINGYLKFANSHPMYDNYDEPEFEVDPKDSRQPISCTVRVYRKDRNRPAVGKVYWSEYERTTDNKRDRWSTAPFDMLEKCALAKALRRSFHELHGTYIPEEADAERETYEREPERPIEKFSRKVKEATAQAVEQGNLLNQTPKPKQYRYDTKEVPGEKLEEVVSYLEDSKATLDPETGLWVANKPLKRMARYEVKS